MSACARWRPSTGGSRTVENTLEILRKHNVTHVIVRADRDRVRPDVLALLKPVLSDNNVTLYEVPGEL